MLATNWCQVNLPQRPQDLDPKMASEIASVKSMPDEGLILLFGMPRSGTTWVGKIFDSHPQTLYRHEPDTWKRLQMPRYPNMADAPKYAEEIRSFTEALPRIQASRVSAKRPFFSKSYHSRIRHHMVLASAWAALVGSRIIPDCPMLVLAANVGYPAQRVVWKSIESLGRLGLMLETLPKAYGIHLLRHPCGYIASVLRGEKDRKFVSDAPTSEDYGIFGAVSGTTLDQKYGLSAIDFSILAPHERLAWQWVLLNEKALADCQMTGRSLCMRYEDLCLNPEGQVAQMFATAGLDMSPQTRAFVASSTTRSKQGYYSVFKDPLQAAMRWERELSKNMIGDIMAIIRCSPFWAYYGQHEARPAGTEI